MLDLDYIREAFPALEPAWGHLDNAGGTAAPRAVIDRIGAAMERATIARGGRHPRSQETAELDRLGHAAVAEWIGADPREVVLGGSSTVNLDLLARSLRPTWAAGDEVIVTNLDHEANIGPWRRLAATGITIREWSLCPDTATLELEDLRRLLNKRTRLVAFTHCANVVGAIHDVRAATQMIHDAGALACVDGVAFGPHRQVDVDAWDVDFYAVSLYKIFGPHVGALFGKREHLLAGAPPTHGFLKADDVPYRYEPGGASPELLAGLPGILDYFDALDHHTFAVRGDADEAPKDRLFRAIAEHEASLAEILLSALRAAPGARIIGPETSDPALRVALVAFQIAGVPSHAIVAALAEAGLAVRSGHFYAPRALAALELDPACEGLVRASLAHYNTPDEMRRMVQALEPFLDPAR